MIELLAERADAAADAELNTPGEYHPDWHTVRDKKFAELIVAECGIVLAKGLQGVDANVWYTNVARFNKHLGIKP